MKTLFALALLFSPVLAHAQYDACIVRACFDTAEVCTAKIGNSPSTLPLLGCPNPVASRGDVLPRESQVMLADNFRLEALIPLPKVPLRSTEARMIEERSATPRKPGRISRTQIRIPAHHRAGFEESAAGR